MMKKVIPILLFFVLSPLLSLCQLNSDNVLIKLNKLYKETRLLSTGKVQEIFINRTNKTVDIDNRIIPLTNYTASYENSYQTSFKRNIDKVWLTCLDGQNCITLPEDDPIKGLGLFFKSKKASYDFINLLDQLKQSIINTD